MHYARWQKWGDPNRGGVGYARQDDDLVTRLYRHMNIVSGRCDTPCWEWTASKTTAGYGNLQYKKRKDYTHRFSYEVHVGSIPVGMHVDHLCMNRACFAPEHLELVLQGENNRRMMEARCGV